MEDVPLTHLAAFLGACFILKHALAHWHTVSNANKECGYDDSTLLEWTVKGKQFSPLKLLLSKGANPNNAMDQWDGLCSVAKSNPDMLELLLQLGLDLNARYSVSRGDTSLMVAVQRYDVKVVELLLCKGASPNIANLIGRTPLHFAASYRTYKMVELLLKFRADPNKCDCKGNTPSIGSIRTA